MSARATQVARALTTRERQVADALAIEELLEDQPTHHGYAINVKVHDSLCECEVRESEFDCDCGWEDAAAEFWFEANRLAQQHDFARVYQDGRMGGWAVVSPQPRTDDMFEFQVEEWERDTFGPFALAILRLLEEHRRAWTER